MKPKLREALRHELAASRELELRGSLDAAFAHLERAHILSQRYAFAHAAVHVRMLRVGWKRRAAAKCWARPPAPWLPCSSPASGCRSATPGAPT
jgi:hypothetical protein